MYTISENAISLRTGGVTRKHPGMKYVFCPECGRQISKSGKGTVSELPCPKCGSGLTYFRQTAFNQKIELPAERI